MEKINTTNKMYQQKILFTMTSARYIKHFQQINECDDQVKLFMEVKTEY